ncbi:uncharacterized protein (TIGR02231 family) [Limibacillus sp. MBR-115]
MPGEFQGDAVMQTTRIFSAAFFMAVATPFVADAKMAVELSQAPIDSVTVYPQGARIERRLALAMSVGSDTLELSGLTAALDPGSIRVATTNGGLRIASVESRLAYSTLAPRAEVRRLEADIEALQDERTMLEDRLRVADRQLDLVGALIDAAASSEDAETTVPRSADHWRQMLTLIGEGSEAAYARQREARKALRGLIRRLETTQQELAALQTPGRETYSLVLALEASEAGSAEINLSYQVQAAQWRPLYDARLDTSEGKLALTQLAEVTQNSGEDWSQVALTLSTTRPRQMGALPNLGPWFLDLYDPRRRASMAQDKLAEAPAAESESLRKNELADAAGAGWEAQIVASEFAAEWRVPGRANLPADGAAHKLRLEERGFEVALSAKIMPKVSPVAYLVGELDYDGEAPLLPGEVSIYRDGAFVGRQSFGLLRPSETREIAFGLDDRIAVEYRLVTGEVASAGIIANDRKESRLYAIKVQNHHARPIAISVLDQLPVSRHEEIEVALLDESTTPSEFDVEERKGVLAWRWNAEPGEVKDLRFGYSIRFPENMAVVGL